MYKKRESNFPDPPGIVDKIKSCTPVFRCSQEKERGIQMKKRIVAMGMALALAVALTPTALAQQTNETTAEQDRVSVQQTSETAAEPVHASEASVQTRASSTYAVPGTNIVLSYAIEEDNEWLYGVETPYVEITGCNSDGAGVLTIPAELEGIPVKVIDWKELTAVHDLKGIVVPEGVEVLTDFYFSISDLQFVYLPSTIQRIEDDFPLTWNNAPTELFLAVARNKPSWIGKTGNRRSQQVCSGIGAALRPTRKKHFMCTTTWTPPTSSV